jgi:DNA/RNA endonuclease YhcR with UshA esterase domain
MRIRSVLLLAAAAVIVATAASAHHSFGATYEVSKEIKLDGKIVQFVYRNPHSFVHVEAPDTAGAQQRWAIEWAGTAQLTGQGITRDTLKVGDAVTVVGRPSRVPGEYRVLMVNLKRPSDGFTWGSRASEVVD